MIAIAHRQSSPRTARIRRVCRALLCAAICLVGVNIASAQPNRAADARPDAASTNTTATDDAQLRSRLASLKKQLEQERTASAEFERRRGEELRELESKRAETADRLLSLEIERTQNADKLKSLESANTKAADDAKSAAAEASAVADSAREAAEQLRLHLREVPGNDARVEKIRAIAAGLMSTPGTAKDKSPKTAAQAELIKSLFAELDAAHDGAMRVTTNTASIYTATGDREEVKLLAVGHVRFAYETVSGSRIGIALSSEQEATGYRWTEDLSSETQDAIRSAIAAASSGNGGLVDVPVDPTGKLRPEGMNVEQSLWDWFAAGGMAMYPLALVGLAALFISLERVWYLYWQNPNADALGHNVNTAVSKGDFNTAAVLCENRRGAAARVMAACLARRPQGQRAMEDAIQEQLLHELPPLHRFTSSLATFANVAPLLGLLGTVAGIIRTFSVITVFGNANPVLMAGGISEALIATAFGLIVAVPVVIAHSLLRSRSESVLADAERHAASLLTLLVHRNGASESKSAESKAVEAKIVDAETFVAEERPRANNRPKAATEQRLAPKKQEKHEQEVALD
jgi:biopolymer transport protein ExbB